ncbi:hypothetical protein TWF569_005870 [Orbilia oligospora]|nr:hypothetical protein TWF569_005870 [Orbilia oligospora]
MLFEQSMVVPRAENDTGGNSSDEEYGETLERQWRYVLRLSANRKLVRRGDTDITLYSTDTSTKFCTPLTSSDHPPFTVTYTTRRSVLTAVNINIVALGGDTQKISVCRNTAHPVTRYKYIYLTETLSFTTTKTAFRDRFRDGEGWVTETQVNYIYITTMEADCIYAFITTTATKTATRTKTDMSISTLTVATAEAVTASSSANKFGAPGSWLTLGILGVLAFPWV